MSDFLLIHTRICIDLRCFEASWWDRNWYLDLGAPSGCGKLPWSLVTPHWPSWYNRNWYLDLDQCGVTSDLGSSPQPQGEALGLWWASQVAGDTTMTSILVSIPISNSYIRYQRFYPWHIRAVGYCRAMRRLYVSASVLSSAPPPLPIYSLDNQRILFTFGTANSLGRNMNMGFLCSFDRT